MHNLCMAFQVLVPVKKGDWFMKVVAFNGSPRREGNTSILINYVLKELDAEGIETEHVPLAGKTVKGCIACFKCWENQDKRCAVTNDDANMCIEKMIEADGIILGSPVYYADVSSQLKALIYRSGFVGGANGGMYKRKLGAAVIAVRRGGMVHAFNTINHFFLIAEMIIPGSSYWNHGIGMNPGDVENDEEGIKTMRDLGTNMAWLLKKIAD